MMLVCYTSDTDEHYTNLTPWTQTVKCFEKNFPSLSTMVVARKKVTQWLFKGKKDQWINDVYLEKPF